MNNYDEPIAKAALKLPAEFAGIVADDAETELWHLLRSLLEFCDFHQPRIDFDRVLEDVRGDFQSSRRWLGIDS